MDYTLGVNGPPFLNLSHFSGDVLSPTAAPFTVSLLQQQSLVHPKRYPSHFPRPRLEQWQQLVPLALAGWCSNWRNSTFRNEMNRPLPHSAQFTPLTVGSWAGGQTMVIRIWICTDIKGWLFPSSASSCSVLPRTIFHLDSCLLLRRLVERKIYCLGWRFFNYIKYNTARERMRQYWNPLWWRISLISVWIFKLNTRSSAAKVKWKISAAIFSASVSPHFRPSTHIQATNQPQFIWL